MVQLSPFDVPLFHLFLVSEVMLESLLSQSLTLKLIPMGGWTGATNRNDVNAEMKFAAPSWLNIDSNKAGFGNFLRKDGITFQSSV